MPEVKVKWAANKDLHDAPMPSLNPRVPWVHQTPVLTLDQLKKWSKEEFRCDCGRGLFGEPHLVWCKHRIYERLLAQVQAWKEGK